MATISKTANNNGVIDNNEYALKPTTMTTEEINEYYQTHGASNISRLEQRIEKRRLEVEKASAEFDKQVDRLFPKTRKVKVNAQFGEQRTIETYTVSNNNIEYLRVIMGKNPKVVITWKLESYDVKPYDFFTPPTTTLDLKPKDVNEIVSNMIWNAEVINGHVHLSHYRPDDYEFNFLKWRRVSAAHTLARRATKAARLARCAGYLAYMGGRG